MFNSVSTLDNKGKIFDRVIKPTSECSYMVMVQKLPQTSLLISLIYLKFNQITDNLIRILKIYATKKHCV